MTAKTTTAAQLDWAALQARLAILWARAAPVVLPAGGAILVALGLLGSALMTRAALRRRRLARMASGGTWFRLIPPPEPDADGGRVFWRTLHLRRRGEPWVVWHFYATAGQVGIWLWAPDIIAAENLMRAVEGAWKGARTERGDPPEVVAPVLPSARQMWRERAAWHRAKRAGEDVAEPTTPAQRLVGAELGLRSAAPHALDHAGGQAHMDMLMAQVANLLPGEAVVVQLLARPAPARAYRDLLRDAALLEGEARHLRDAKAPGATRAAVRVRAADPKLSDALWMARIRVAVLGNHPGRATTRIDGVTSAFGVLRGPAQSLERRYADVVPFDLRHHHRAGEVLSVDEMSALATLPAASVLEASRARVVPAGKEVASEGIVLGQSAGRHVAIRLADLLMHCQVIGPNGAGKTTLLARMALQILDGGWSLVAADIAKGDIPDLILGLLPEAFRANVCLIDPSAASVPGINVLATDNPALTTEQLLTTFSRLYAGAWGPKIESILRASFMTLAMAGGTLVEVPLLLTDERFRARILAQALNGTGPGRSPLAIDQLAGFWEAFADKSDAAQSRELDSVLYKLESFMPPPIAAVIGQVNAKGDPLDLVDEGGLVLVRAPRGEVGEGPAALLASLVAIRLWQRVLGRAALPEAHRRQAQRVAFVADEAQDLFGSRSRSASRTAEEMFVQGRGLGLSFILGHQHLGQLTDDLTATLMTNARTKVLFQCSDGDAKKFAAEVAPEFRPADLMALSAYQAIVKPCIRGGQGAPFTLRTENLPERDEGLVLAAAAASAERWARPRAEVEEEMVARHRGGLSVVR